jgi:putative tricarboxylic transport membrane protein
VSERGAVRAPRLTNDRVAGLVLAAVGLAIAWDSRQYPFGSLAEPGPGYLPFALSLSLAAFGLLVAFAGRHGRAFALAQFGDAGKTFAILAGLGFAAIALERIGYPLTVIIMLVYYLGVVERRHWLPTLLLAVGMAYGSYGLFAKLLKVQLPRGPLGF